MIRTAFSESSALGYFYAGNLLQRTGLEDYHIFTCACRFQLYFMHHCLQMSGVKPRPFLLGARNAWIHYWTHNVNVRFGRGC
jgi:hypothetical protein